MRSALVAFERSIRDLRWFITSLDFERAALSTLNASDVVDGDPSNSLKDWSSHLTHGVVKRQFDYNGIIITLYGLLEQYVENLIVGYTRHLNAVVPSFSDIPDAVKNSHVELSLCRKRHARLPMKLLASYRR